MDRAVSLCQTRLTATEVSWQPQSNGTQEKGHQRGNLRL